jgi:ketosteroid isomerase-like protein
MGDPVDQIRIALRQKLPRVLKSIQLGSVAAILFGCSAGHDTQADTRQLMQTSRDWARVAAGRNVDAVVDYWTDDAVVMIPGLPTFRGKSAIRKYVIQSLKTPGFQISWEPLEAHVSKSGEMGYMLERSTVTMADSKGTPRSQQFRAVTIWRKGNDGKWRNVVDASISD